MEERKTSKLNKRSSVLDTVEISKENINIHQNVNKPKISILKPESSIRNKSKAGTSVFINEMKLNLLKKFEVKFIEPDEYKEMGGLPTISLKETKSTVGKIKAHKLSDVSDKSKKSDKSCRNEIISSLKTRNRNTAKYNKSNYVAKSAKSSIFINSESTKNKSIYINHAKVQKDYFSLSTRSSLFSESQVRLNTGNLLNKKSYENEVLNQIDEEDYNIKESNTCLKFNFSEKEPNPTSENLDYGDNIEDYYAYSDGSSINSEEANGMVEDYLNDRIEEALECSTKVKVSENFELLLKSYLPLKFFSKEDFLKSLFELKMHYVNFYKKKEKVNKIFKKIETNNFNHLVNYKAEHLLNDLILKATANVYNESLEYIKIIIKLQSNYRGRIARIIYKVNKMNHEINKEEKRIFKNKKIYSIVKKMVKIPPNKGELKANGFFKLNKE